MKGNGIRFFPLYWIYHDQWQYTFTNPIWGGVTYCNHDGHIHFFMMGFDVTTPSQQAYSGCQKFEFNLKDIWSPKSDDVNKQFNFRIVGYPKWYFYIEEYWRRVYIQQWDDINNPDTPSIVGKRGIKYDASKSFHTFGPFREGKDNVFFYTDLCRTLPIEYWHNDNKTVRDHWLRYGDGVRDDLKFKFNFNRDIDEDDRRDRWVIPIGQYAGKDPGNGGNPNEDEARCSAYHDKYYIYPTLEYMKRIHLAWERLPGWQERDKEDEDTGERFGDGFSISISIPYTINGKIQSPFSDDNGNVAPPGTYYHGVKQEDYLRYKNISNPPNPYDPPIEWAGKPVNFHIPNSSFPLDGKWVEQCLGGIIQAKVKVIIEDTLGYRYTNWVHATQFYLAEQFEGKDQNAPYPT